MEIPLETRLSVTYLREEDKQKSILLAKLVDKKLHDKKYWKRINDILVEAGKECLDDLEFGQALNEFSIETLVP